MTADVGIYVESSLVCSQNQRETKTNWIKCVRCNGNMNLVSNLDPDFRVWKHAQCGSLAFWPIWNSWHKAEKQWVCECWSEAVKTHRQTRRRGNFLYGNSIKKEPQRRLDDWQLRWSLGHPSRGESVFMCLCVCFPSLIGLIYSIWLQGCLSDHHQEWLRVQEQASGTTCGTPPLSLRDQCLWGAVARQPSPPMCRIRRRQKLREYPWH